MNAEFRDILHVSHCTMIWMTLKSGHSHFDQSSKILIWEVKEAIFWLDAYEMVYKHHLGKWNFIIHVCTHEEPLHAHQHLAVWWRKHAYSCLSSTASDLENMEVVAAPPIEILFTLDTVPSELG